MDEDLSQLEVNLTVDDDISPLEMEELTAAMRRELLLLDVQSVDRVSGGPAPDGAKGIELAALGALIVEYRARRRRSSARSSRSIQAWAARSPNRTVKLTLDGRHPRARRHVRERAAPGRQGLDGQARHAGAAATRRHDGQAKRPDRRDERVQATAPHGARGARS